MKLKPCPFCGGKALFCRDSVLRLGRWNDAVFVYCKSCNARSAHVLYDAKVHQNDGEYIEAAEAWNRRESVDEIVEQLEDYKMWKEFMVYDLTHRELKIITKAIEIVKGGVV